MKLSEYLELAQSEGLKGFGKYILYKSELHKIKKLIKVSDLIIDNKIKNKRLINEAIKQLENVTAIGKLRFQTE